MRNLEEKDMESDSTIPPAAIRELLDKQAITEIIYQYCRGIDRMDRELTLACWHEDGTDSHGNLYTGTAQGFVDWVWPVHEGMERTQHTIHNILIEVHGDDAYSESYWTVHLRVPAGDGLEDIVGAGRYTDHFTRRDGTWKIQHRDVIYDWLNRFKVMASHAEGSVEIPPNNPEVQSFLGLRSKDDHSYHVFRSTYAGRG